MPDNVQDNLLTLLLDTVTFLPVFARLPAGEGERLGALGALMLSKAIGWQMEIGRNVWIGKSLEEWMQETAMDEAEIGEARRRLRKTVFWKEKENCAPNPCFAVFVDLQALEDALEHLDD